MINRTRYQFLSTQLKTELFRNSRNCYEYSRGGELVWVTPRVVRLIPRRASSIRGKTKLKEKKKLRLQPKKKSRITHGLVSRLRRTNTDIVRILSPGGALCCCVGFCCCWIYERAWLMCCIVLYCCATIELLYRAMIRYYSSEASF